MDPLLSRNTNKMHLVIEFIIPKFISVYIYGLFGVYKFDIHGCVHRRLLSRNTNKISFVIEFIIPKFNPFQFNSSDNRILPSSYLFWAGKRLVDYL
jgi:hypothetical protein